MSIVKKGRIISRDNIFNANVANNSQPNALVQTTNTGKISDSFINTTSTDVPNAVLYTNSSGTIDKKIIAKSLYTDLTVFVNQSTGDDNNPGTLSAPFKTLTKAFSLGCPQSILNIVLLSHYTFNPSEGGGFIGIKSGTYVLSLNNFDLNASVYPNSVPGYNSITHFGCAGHVNLIVNFAHMSKITIPSSSLPLAPISNGLFTIYDGGFAHTSLNIHLEFDGSTSGTSAMEINSGSLISRTNWHHATGSMLNVSLYPHYNRIINLYGTNTFLVNFSGRATGSIGFIITNDTFGSFIRRDSSNISLSAALAGINYSSGIPININMS